MMFRALLRGVGPSDVRFGQVGKREPPAEILRRLREIDPNADVRWVPSKIGELPRWELGVWWQPNRMHRLAAIRALDRQLRVGVRHRKPGRIRLARDILRGWRPVFQVVRDQPNAEDVEDFRERDWIFRHTFHAALEAHVDYIDRSEEERQEEFTGQLHDAFDDRTLYGMLVKGRKSVLTTGIPVAG